MLDGESGRCTVCSDYQASTTNGQCGTDNRPRQLTAFLLSLFLSGTGAANFYIGQNSLGKFVIKCVVMSHSSPLPSLLIMHSQYFLITLM